MARLAGRLEEQGHLRPGVSVEEAAHILWVVASFDSFDLLHTGRGLPLEETTPAARRDGRASAAAAMTPERLRAACLALLGTTQEWPFRDPSPSTFKVGSRISRSAASTPSRSP